MSASVAQSEKTQNSGGGLDLEAVYEGDELETARVLLMILGLPAEEIERVVANMSLDSFEEM